MPDSCTVILSTSYLPPIQYFSKFYLCNRIFIEKHENYQKQSYRNRCVIYAANGPLILVIPIKKKQGTKLKISDIKIDYDLDWQKLHWKSIVSAYKNSPYFDFYEEKFTHFYEKREVFLLDLNNRILKELLENFYISKFPEYSNKYNSEGSFIDYRQSINPKKRLMKLDSTFYPEPYHQVFADKFGFISNLSIIDLLFNKGPESSEILKNSIKKGH